MEGHSDTHIEQRIKWRASRHRLPREGTGFWDGAPEWLKERVGDEVRLPVVFSFRDEQNFTVIGVDSVLGLNNGSSKTMALDDIRLVHSSEVSLEISESAMQLVELLDFRRGRMRCWAEAGPGCLCIWDLLTMLKNMQKRGAIQASRRAAKSQSKDKPRRKPHQDGAPSEPAGKASGEDAEPADLNDGETAAEKG